MKHIREERVKVKNRVLLNPLLRRVAIFALSTSFIVNSPIYKYIHQRQMSHVMKAYSESPQIVQIEVTNTCNLYCPNCPNKTMQRKRGFMEMGVFKRIVDEYVTLGANSIHLSGMGEPTLHPQLVNQVTYAKTRGVRSVLLATNATFLTPQLSEGLIKGGLDELMVSIDAATSETYSKMRPPGSLEVVEENLKTLIRLRNEMQSSKPLVTVKFIKEPRNTDEVGLFKRKWKNLAVEIYIGFLHNWGGAIDKKEPEWQGSPTRDPCCLMFRCLDIRWDGKVALCPLDIEASVVLGDVKEESIKEIWHGSKLQAIRQAHLNGHFNEIPLCDKCSFRDVWWVY